MPPIDATIPLQVQVPDNSGKLMQFAQMQQMGQQRQQQAQQQAAQMREHKRVKAMAERGTGLFMRYQTLKDNGFSEQAAHAAMQEDYQRELGGLASLRDDNGAALFSQDEMRQFGQGFDAGQLGSILPQLMGADKAMDAYFKNRELKTKQDDVARTNRRLDVDSRRLDLDSRKADEAERANRANEAIRAKAAGGGGQVIENEDGTQTVVPPPGKRTPIPSEIQSRMALGETYAKQVPDLLRAIEQGKSGALGTAFNVGTSGLLAKRQESGVDALVRNLTGAGKSKEEAESYASRYQFEATDSDARKKEKVLQLVGELKAIDSAVKAGRGWPASSAYDGIEEPKPLSDGPQVGSVEDGYRFKGGDPKDPASWEAAQ
jgi:hypothetical protein